MATILEVNKERFLNRVKSNLDNALFNYNLKENPGLSLEEALIPMGEPWELGEKELDNIITEVILQVEIALIPPKRKVKKHGKRV